MADVTLNPVQRDILIQRLNVAAVREQTTERLSTGRKINSVTDGPHDYFRASALTARVNDLLATKSDIGRGIDTLAASQVGTDAIEKLADQLKGLAYSAEGNEALRSTLAEQFDVVRGQIDNLVKDTSFLGVNLLSNPADSLRVSVSDQPGKELTVTGDASDSAGLSIGSAVSDYGNFATLADIENALTAVDAAISQVRRTASDIGSNAAILQVREDFTQDLANVLQSGADKLVSADLNAEGAKALAAGVRDSLAGEAQRIAARSEAAVVDLIAA